MTTSAVITMVEIWWHTWDSLTHEESKVCTLIANGWSNEEIADELDMSSAMAYRRRRSAMRKLKLRNDAEVTRHAVAHGYIPAPTIDTCVRALDGSTESWDVGKLPVWKP